MAKASNAELVAEIEALRQSLQTERRERQRLQAELEQCHTWLAEALEQQTATSEILRVISQSPTDVQPVFDAIAVNALRLCDAQGAVVVRYDGALLHVAAHHNVNSEAVDRLERQYPVAPDRDHPLGEAVLDGAVVHVAGPPGRGGVLGVGRASVWGAKPRVDPAPPPGSRRRGHRDLAAEARSLHRPTDRSPKDVRRPGGDRDRECAAVQ
jgi:hypothetical protein